MKMIHGISMIFLIIGFLLAPGCVFAAANDYSTDSGLNFQSEKINPLEKGEEVKEVALVVVPVQKK